MGRVSRYLGSEPYHLLAGGGLKYLDWARGGSRNFVLLDVALKANVYTIARTRGVVAQDGVRACVALPVSLYSSNRLSMARIR